MKKPDLKQVSILGVPVTAGGMVDIEGYVWERMEADRWLSLFTPNPEQVMLAQRREDFKRALQEAGVTIADGYGLVWAEQRLAQREGRKPQLTERVSGIDLAERLMAGAVEREKNVFLVGGRSGVAEKAAERLSERFKDLSIQGAQGPERVSDESEAEFEDLVDLIKAKGVDILLVAFGAPEQELWVMKHRDALEASGVKLAMVVGGAVDVWAGNVSRAPAKWREKGFEWLWRLVHQPWRLKRQLRLVEFVVRAAAGRNQ